MSEGLLAALDATLSPNADERAGAENYLKQLEISRGHTVELMSVMTREDLSIGARQAAAIRLKNIVKKRCASMPRHHALLALDSRDTYINTYRLSTLRSLFSHPSHLTRVSLRDLRCTNTWSLVTLPPSLLPSFPPFLLFFPPFLLFLLPSLSSSQFLSSSPLSSLHISPEHFSPESSGAEIWQLTKCVPMPLHLVSWQVGS